MALNTVSSDRLSTNVKNTNFTAAEKQDLTNDILPLATQFGQSKNLIINGAMQVAQRGSASSTTNGLATVDRFKKIGSGLGNTFSQEQITLSSSDTPYSSGFRKAFRVSQNQAGTANAAGAIDFSHYIEAQNLTDSGWNYTSASSKITLQFWFRASTNQTFYGFLLSSDGTVQRNTFSFTASGNNTWTKVTKTFTGNSNITINNDNGTGLIVYLIPYYGTDYQGSISLDTWTTLANNDYVPSMASTWLTAGASTFDVTGMQLEVSDHATSFEHRSFAQELALCQRYYYRHAEGAVDRMVGSGCVYNSSINIGYIQFPCQMRAIPSMDAPSGTNYYKVVSNNSTQYQPNCTIEDGNINCSGFRFSGGTSTTTGHGAYFRLGDASAYVAFSAEL